MKISTKGRYSLRAMIDIAVYGKSDPVRLKDMAERTHISRNYLVKLFQELKKYGLVVSTQGRTGGFQLAKAPAAIKIIDILQAADESVIPVACADCNPGSDICPMMQHCAAYDFWNEFKLYTEKFFKNRTLADMLALAEKKQ